MKSEAPGAPRLLSIKDAAAYLGLSVWQVKHLVWARTIPPVRLGRRVYLDRRDLEALPDRFKER